MVSRKLPRDPSLESAQPIKQSQKCHRTSKGTTRYYYKALAKRSQQFGLTTHLNIVGPLIICKPRPNDRNISTQHIATLGATCCVRLATMLRRVAACYELKIELVRMPRRNIVARTWPNDYNIMQHLQILCQKFDHFQI